MSEQNNSVTLAPMVNMTDVLHAYKVRVEERRIESEQAVEHIRTQIKEACEIATMLATDLGTMSHWFIAGDRDFVEAAKEPDGPVMAAYNSRLIPCRQLLADGSLERDGTGFKIGDKKPHCVVPARISAMRELSKLSQKREGDNGDALRGLTVSEILQIAEEIGAVVSAGQKTNNRFDDGSGKFFAIANNGDATTAEHVCFLQILADAASKIVVKPKPPVVQKTLQEQATTVSLKWAIDNGGIYLAIAPSLPKPDGTGFFFGGAMLLRFDKATRKVTIGATADQPFAEGHNLFVKAVKGADEQGASISVDDVAEIVFANAERPDIRMRSQDKRLWYYVFNHFNWMKQYHSDVDAMTKNPQLTKDQFLAGETGNIVLEAIYPVKVGESETVSQVAISLSQFQEGEERAIRVCAMSEELMPSLGHLIGKVQKHNYLPKDLDKLIKACLG